MNERSGSPSTTALKKTDAGVSLTQGQILANRYEIRRPLGRGGMGEVWLAFDLRLRVEVALKALQPDAFSHARAAELLHREIRAAREVISPNVCRIFDLVEADGLELLSMEYVDGVTLREILDERSPLDRCPIHRPFGSTRPMRSAGPTLSPSSPPARSWASWPCCACDHSRKRPRSRAGGRG